MPLARRTKLPALLLLAALAGCEGSGDAATATAMRDTLPNGAERVRHGPLSAEAPEPLVPDLSIGLLEGDSPYIFGNVRGIEVGPDGAIYVIDHQASELRVFDPDGSFRGYAARRGQGPGEIMQANGVVRAPDGTLWVQDHGQWQLIRLRPEGGEVERMPMFVRQFGYLWDGAVDDDGRIWTAASRSLDSTPGQPPEAGLHEGTVEESVIIHDPATGVEDSVHVATRVGRSYVVELDGGWRFYQIPFDPTLLKAVDPAGAIWSAMSGTYRISRLGTGGDTTLVIEVDRAPARVTSEDRDAHVRDARERGPEEERVAREISREMREHKPALSQLAVDDEGRLWVRHYAEDAEEPAHFDVFDREGHYLGSMRLAVRTPPYFIPRIRDGHLYTMALDEHDVPSVVRVPIELGGSGG